MVFDNDRKTHLRNNANPSLRCPLDSILHRPIGLGACPIDGQTINIEAYSRKEIDVFFETLILIDRDMTREINIGRDYFFKLSRSGMGSCCHMVYGALPFPLLKVSLFTLIGCGCITPKEELWKRFIRKMLSFSLFPL